MLAMALLLVVALRARSEADRQRAKAEGLVEYMLTDLREKLKGVGRLDVMTAVNERAMAYYGDQQSLEGLPPESLDRRARILHAMGEDDEKRGDLDKALVKFKEAHRTTAAVLAKRPNDPDAIFAHAQSEYWVGRIAEMRQDWGRAELNYRAYASSANRLIQLRPNDPDFMMEVAWGHMNLGNIKLESRAPPDYGQTEYQLALKWMNSALAQRPNDKAILTELGNAYAWLADTYFIRGDFKSSLTERRNQLTMARKNLLNHENDATVRFEVSKASYSVAINLQKVGNEREAQNLLRAAKTESDVLVGIDGSNHEWRRLTLKISESISGKGDIK
jgi:tetratricopeptide (TPR) repeat protein